MCRHDLLSRQQRLDLTNEPDYRKPTRQNGQIKKPGRERPGLICDGIYLAVAAGALETTVETVVTTVFVVGATTGVRPFLRSSAALR